MWKILTRKGVKSKATQLSKYEAAEISYLCDVGVVSSEELRRFYGLTSGGVNHIRSGKNWNFVTHRRERPEWKKKYGWFMRYSLIFDIIRTNFNRAEYGKLAEKYKLPCFTVARIARKNLLTSEWALINNGDVTEDEVTLTSLKQIYLAMEQ